MQIWSTFRLYVRVANIAAFNYLREANFLAGHSHQNKAC